MEHYRSGWGLGTSPGGFLVWGLKEGLWQDRVTLYLRAAFRRDAGSSPSLSSLSFSLFSLPFTGLARTALKLEDRATVGHGHGQGHTWPDRTRDRVALDRIPARCDQTRPGAGSHLTRCGRGQGRT